MYGPRGWDRNVPVKSYTAHFTDGQVLEVNVRKHLKDPKYYVKVMALALGRIFLNTRFGTIRVNVQSDCGCGKSWISSYWTAKSTFFFLTSGQHRGKYLGPKLHPRGRFFGP